MMTKYILLVPLEYNDGSAVPYEVLEQVFDNLYCLAGGYYIAGVGEGSYRMDNGDKQMDTCLQVWVAVSTENHVPLLLLIKSFVSLLKQESIYVEKCVSETMFVRGNEL